MCSLLMQLQLLDGWRYKNQDKSFSLVVVTTLEELVKSVLVASVVSTKLKTKYCDRVTPP